MVEDVYALRIGRVIVVYTYYEVKNIISVLCKRLMNRATFSIENFSTEMFVRNNLLHILKLRNWRN